MGRPGRVAVITVMLWSIAAWLPTAPAGADPTWEPAGTATIHPGVQTVSPVGQCTANFVFFDDDDVFIGHAAHCTGTGGATETDGCLSGSLPVGTEVTVMGASRPATMVYNSWRTMQANGETDPGVCAYNDFALLQLDEADEGRVNPSVPSWGGPAGVNTTGCAIGERTYSYGNSSLRRGLTILSPHVGLCRGDLGGGWSHRVNTLPPDLPGDSGSAYLDSRGRALGSLSVLGIGIPDLAYNGVTDIGRALTYMRSSVPALAGVELAEGTEPFLPVRLPLGILG